MSNPYEKEAFIRNRTCKLNKDLTGHKFIKWYEDNEHGGLIDVSIYDYELEEMLNRLKQYKGE